MNNIEIQKELGRIGLLTPNYDGKWGPQSKSAARAFKRSINSEGETFDTDDLLALNSFRSASDIIFRPKDGASREHCLAVNILNHAKALGMYISISMGSDSPSWNIFYVEGVFPDGRKNNDRVDDWNDTRSLIKVDGNGVVEAVNFLATTEPGWYYRRNRMNSKGCAQIALNKQFFAWSVGRHGSKAYPALVQVDTVMVHRDNNEDGIRVGDPIDTGDYFAINQHHGWNSSTVGQNSAGCLVGKNIKGHEDFMSLLYRDRAYLASQAYRWGTAVLDGSKF